MNKYYLEGYLAYKEGKEYLPTNPQWVIGWNDAVEDAANELTRKERQELEENAHSILKALGVTDDGIEILKRYFKS